MSKRIGRARPGPFPGNLPQRFYGVRRSPTVVQQEPSHRPRLIVVGSSDGDITAPTVTIISGPTRSKIGPVVGRDSFDFVYSSDEDFQAYQVRVVSSSTDTVAMGTLVESGGSGDADTQYTLTVTDDELFAASASDGSKTVKVFVQDLAGNWSI